MKIQKPYHFPASPAPPPPQFCREEDLFSRLPSEILNNILSRLPLRSIATGKCVCKPWLHLLETDEFLTSYLSKSAPALAVIAPGRGRGSNRCKIFEFEEELGLKSHDRLPNPIAELDLSRGEPIPIIEDAANGLLLLKLKHDLLRVCNPITREYINLRCSPEFVVEEGEDSYLSYGYDSTYGIGASKVTGQYKVLRIDHDYPHCHVYTLGTRKWRRIQTDASFDPSFVSFCAFLNGYLHWVTSKLLDSASMICCFDVEAECFSSFLAPSLEEGGRGGDVSLSVLNGCLCFCNGSGDRIEIWLMKEYGVEESWSKEFVVEMNPLRSDGYSYYSVNPIRVFKNGDILMVGNRDVLLYYSDKSKTTREIGSFASRKDFSVRPSLLTLSFVSLRSLSLRKEKVITF